MEQKRFGKANCGPRFLIVEYSKPMIKVILQEFSGESLFHYLDRAYRIVPGDS